MIYLETVENQLVIAVINDCPPLPEFVVEKAFERYFSQPLASNHGTQNRSQKGTGLGLTLVKQVIEHHQGQVSFEQGKLMDFVQKKDVAAVATMPFSPEQSCVQVKLILNL